MRPGPISARLFAALLALLLGAGSARAGAFIFCGEGDLDIVTHPIGYTGFQNSLTVDVCVLTGTPNADLAEVAAQRAVDTWNALSVTTFNIQNGSVNDIPPTFFDLESVLLHELGHCGFGIAHPNLASESGLTGAAMDYSKSTDGVNDGMNKPMHYDLNNGADNTEGSSDDLRGDDENLHWFKIADNNPFTIAGTVDSTSYSRDLADLPVGHTYAANADRGVGTLLIGGTTTEAVMQQGTSTDEAQRTLVADDVAMARYGMSGRDELAGTGDDYTVIFDYIGQASSCDVEISFDDLATGFAGCTTTGSGIGFDHVRITSASIAINSGWNWFFAAECGDGVIAGNEACDDGDTDSGDGCDASCELESGWLCAGVPTVCSEDCGDGAIVGGESCDDGGTAPGDGCDAACAIEPGWLCAGEPSSCSEDCGDGLIVGGEACDDGGAAPGDGCDAACMFETGWSCGGEPTSCSEICGDTLLVGGEQCDDGGTAPGDCCGATCQYESQGSPCDDGNACTEPDGCDGAGACDAGPAIVCDDADVCTDNGCDPGSGCVYTPNTAPCEDGNACSDGDVCSGGSCQAGGPLDCDDLDPCTADACDELSGCTHDPIGPFCGTEVPSAPPWAHPLLATLLLTATALLLRGRVGEMNLRGERARTDRE